MKEASQTSSESHFTPMHNEISHSYVFVNAKIIYNRVLHTQGFCLNPGIGQKKDPSPFFTLISLFCRYKCLIFNRSACESPNLCLTLLITLFLRYSAFAKSCQIPFSLSNFHHHFPTNLCFFNVLYPQPSFFLLLQMATHLIIWYFLLRPLHDRRKCFFVCLSL